MPKHKTKTEEEEEERQEEGREVVGDGSRHRSKTFMSVLRWRSRLRRNRTGSVESPGDGMSVKAKCATLPARMKAPPEMRGSKPRTLFWMEQAIDLLEGTPVTRKDSDESVDSGFHQNPKVEGSESDSYSPPQPKALVSLSEKHPPPPPPHRHTRHDTPPPHRHTCQDSPLPPPPPPHAKLALDSPPPLPLHVHPSRDFPPALPPHGHRSPTMSSMYDSAAFERAFGPMKDIGRWYSTYQQVQGRPGSAMGYTLDDEEDERLASRPLPPIPPAGTADSGLCVVRHFESGEKDGVYEQVEARVCTSNGLTLGLRNLARHGWYWGPVTRLEAEEKLLGTDDGTFLVRDSSDDRYLLSLSFRSQGKTLHTRIEYSSGFFSFYSFPDSESEGYRSVVELIEKSMEYSRDGVFCFSRARAWGSPAVPVRLLKALSRYNHVRSLQHYCRFVIRQSIRFDRIRQLPLPKHVHSYIEQSQF